MATFDALADLPLEIEGYELEGLEFETGELRTADDGRSTSGAAARRGSARTSSTTPSTTSPCRTPAPTLDLTGHATLGEFCEFIGGVDTFPRRAASATSRATTGAGPSSRRRSTWRCARRGSASPRRSAASRGRSTSSARCASSARRGRAAPRSSRCGASSTAYPDLRFKLDPTNDWDDELIAELVETGAVDSLDLKGFYKGTAGRRRDRPRALREADRGLPRRLARGPRRQRRDPAAARAGRATGSPGTRRSTRSPTSRRCPGRREMVNIKPSRFGGLRDLCATYDYCDERGIGAYGGGQWELGVGPRPDPVPRLALPSRHAQRHRPARLQRPRAGAEPGLPTSPLEPRLVADRLPLGRARR